MPARVVQHRVNGRPFDQVFYIQTTFREREYLERTLIGAINPSQNRAGKGRNSPAPPAGPSAQSDRKRRWGLPSAKGVLLWNGENAVKRNLSDFPRPGGRLDLDDLRHRLPFYAQDIEKRSGSRTA